MPGWGPHRPNSSSELKGQVIVEDSAKMIFYDIFLNFWNGCPISKNRSSSNQLFALGGNCIALGISPGERVSP